MPNDSVASLLEQGHNQLDRGEYQAALQIFQQAAVLEPQNPQINYGLGLACYHLEQYHESIGYLNQALRIKPNYILALVWRGLACQKIDQAQQAQADFYRAIALTLQDSEDWRGRGIALDELQRYEEVLPSFDQALKIKPDNDEVWYNRGIWLGALERLEEAVASFDQALKIKPDNHEVWYIRGGALAYLERYEEAVASFDQALKIKPDNDKVWYDRGIWLGALGRFEEALASFDQALKIKPDNDEAWYKRGISLGALGRFKEALASFDQALKIKPDNHEAWNFRGMMLRALERDEEALASYDKALEIKPDNHEAWYKRGNVLDELGRYEEALASYDKALEIKPDNHEAWYKRGNVLDELGRYEEAVASFDEALKIKPDDDEAWNSRGIVLCDDLQRYEEALTSFDKAIEFRSDNYLAWGNRGIALRNLERYEEAVASFDQALKIKPNFDWAWGNRGVALDFLERHEDAVESFDKALKIQPENHGAWHQRGTALRNLGRYEEAVASYKKAQDIDPTCVKGWIDRGIALAYLGRYEEALTSFDRALKIQPDNDEVWYIRGIALGYLERYEEALACYDQALKIKPDFHSAWYNRGIALHKLERYEEAISSYDQAIKFNPDKHEALVNKGNVLVKLKRDTEAIEFYNRALDCIDPQWWEAWNKNQGLAKIYALNEEASSSYDKAIEFKPDKHEALAIESYNRALNRIQPQWWEGWNKNQALANISALNKEAAVKTSVNGINTVHILTPDDRGNSSKSQPEKWKQLYDGIMQQPSLFSDLSEAKKSYEEALEFLTFDKFPTEHLQFLQELLKVYPSDNLEEFQGKLEEGTRQLETLLSKAKSEQEKITLARKFAAFNQMRVDIYAQLEVPEAHIEALKTAEERKNTCLAWLREGSIDQPPTGFEFEQTEKLLNPKTAAIYWHLSPIAITTFIIKHNEPLKILLPQLPSELQQGGYSPYFYQLQHFESWMQQWKKSYQDYCDYCKVSNTDKETTPWRKNMESMLETLGEILEIKRIVQENLQDVDNLILVPHRELHLLPLDYLFEDRNFIITYLPSFQIGLQLLELTSNSENTDSQKLLNIEMPLNNPSDNLFFLPIQSTALYHLYREYGKLPDPPATKTNLIEALRKYEGYFNFTGHGSHNLENPRESALHLTDEKLTLGDILGCLELDLQKYQLICLSACETGMTSQESSKQRIIDEYIGLVSGFLAKGANHVVSTLWRVDEHSTALLIIKFYQLLKERQQTPTKALRQAKDWLRQLTYKDLAKWYSVLAKELNELQLREFLNTEAEIIERDIKEKKKESTELPYAHPYYWAGFILTGKPSTTG